MSNSPAYHAVPASLICFLHQTICMVVKEVKAVKAVKDVKAVRVIRAVIFDMDGIIADTELLQFRGWREVLKPLGITLTRKDYYDYAGDTGYYIEERLIEKYGLKAGRGSLLREKERFLFSWFRTKPLKTMPYAMEAVRYFKGRGIKVGLASGAMIEETKLKLRRLGIAGLFPVIAGRDQVKRSKPYPDVYLHAAHQLRVRPDECIVFEDTEFGLRSAKSAGMICLAIPNELAVKQDFSKADGVFRNLKEAIEYVKKKYVT